MSQFATIFNANENTL